MDRQRTEGMDRQRWQNLALDLRSHGHDVVDSVGYYSWAGTKKRSVGAFTPNQTVSTSSYAWPSEADIADDEHRHGK